MQRIRYFNRKLSSAIFLLFLALGYSGILLGQDIDKVKIVESSPGMLYLGYGPSAYATESNILGLFSDETEDPTPFGFEFENATKTVSETIKAKARIHSTTGDVRVVLYKESNNQVLANMHYYSTGVTDEYVLDVGMENPEIINVGGYGDGVLKLLTFNAYVSAVQGYNMMELPNCSECIKHDMFCSIPIFGFDEVPTYLTLWLGCAFETVNITSCCEDHDINLWCATNIASQYLADDILAGCIMGKLLDAVSGENPWWCGGDLVAYTLALPQIVVYAEIFLTAVNLGTDWAFIESIGTGFTESRGAGYLKNSCLCPGGAKKTVKCDDEGNIDYVMCEGEPDPLLCETLYANAKHGWGCGSWDKGKIDLNVGGGCEPYQYSWSNSSTTEDQSDLDAGTYTVTITDDNGCTLVRTYTIVQTKRKLAVQGNSGYDCDDPDNTGRIDIMPTGGNQPYTYSWSHGPNETSANLDNLTSGTYTVTVTDAAGCSEVRTFELGGQLDISLEISCCQRLDWINQTQKALVWKACVCATGSGGKKLSYINGNGEKIEGYKYSWTNGLNSGSTDTRSCTYFSFSSNQKWVDVIDEQGCTYRKYFSVDNSLGQICPQGPQLPDLDVSVFPNPTTGLFTASIDVNEPVGSNVEVMIYDLYNQQVYFDDLGFKPQGSFTESIDITGNNPGIYVIYLNNGVAYKSFVLN